uniref:Uncharacterized protein n=1 Tax=Crocodylus porosus TaxID=8502 RepID=A0A7M4ELD2_CROPO
MARGQLTWPQGQEGGLFSLLSLRDHSQGLPTPIASASNYHEELCGTSYGSFCLNGGICYMVPTVSSPFSIFRKCSLEQCSLSPIINLPTQSAVLLQNYRNCACYIISKFMLR